MALASELINTVQTFIFIKDMLSKAYKTVANMHNFIHQK